MKDFQPLFDGAHLAWREGVATARLAGKARGDLVAVVLDASLSPDGFPDAFVGDEADVRARLDAIDARLSRDVFGPPRPMARKPFAVGIHRHPDGVTEYESAEITFPTESS